MTNKTGIYLRHELRKREPTIKLNLMPRLYFALLTTRSQGRQQKSFQRVEGEQRKKTRKIALFASSRRGGGQPRMRKRLTFQSLPLRFRFLASRFRFLASRFRFRFRKRTTIFVCYKHKDFRC